MTTTCVKNMRVHMRVHTRVHMRVVRSGNPKSLFPVSSMTIPLSMFMVGLMRVFLELKFNMPW